jgi:hypothetical protein
MAINDDTIPLAPEPESEPGFESAPHAADDLAADPARPKRRPLSWWICFPIGIGAAVVGLVPWLITGMRLPLQNLWAAQTPPDAMPIVLLPFSQYATVVLFALIVMGAAAAGIVTRATRRLQGRGGAFFIALGLLLAQGLAAVQTTLPVMHGLQHRNLATLYLAALVGVVVLSMLIGIVVVVLIGSAPRAGATIGISIAALAAAPWLGELLHPLIGGSPFLLTVLRWTPAVLIGIGLAWGGLNTVGRILAVPVCLAILWVGPAAVTAIDNVAGSRVLAHQPTEMLRSAISVFLAALQTPEIVFPPLIVAVVIGVLGAVALVLWRRRPSTRSADAGEPAGSTDASEPAVSTDSGEPAVPTDAGEPAVSTDAGEPDPTTKPLQS